jgi:hypothetical protein
MPIGAGLASWHYICRTLGMTIRLLSWVDHGDGAVHGAGSDDCGQ